MRAVVSPPGAPDTEAEALLRECMHAFVSNGQDPVLLLESVAAALCAGSPSDPVSCTRYVRAAHMALDGLATVRALLLPRAEQCGLGGRARVQQCEVLV
jgi:hypothetical protein